MVLNNFNIKLLYLLVVLFHCIFFRLKVLFSDFHVALNLIDFCMDGVCLLKKLNLFAHKLGWLELQLGKHSLGLDHFGNPLCHDLSVNLDELLDFLDLFAQGFGVSFLAFDGDDLADEVLDLCSLNKSLSLLG